MPQAVDLVLKNGASTPVDKTFTLLSPAAGYGSIAEWALKEGGAPNLYPRITSMVRAGQAPGSGVKLPTTVVQGKLRVPYGFTDVNGVPSLVSAAEANISVTLPQSFPDARVPDFVAYLKNYIGHVLFQHMVSDRAPAT